MNKLSQTKYSHRGQYTEIEHVNIDGKHYVLGYYEWIQLHHILAIEWTSLTIKRCNRPLQRIGNCNKTSAITNVHPSYMIWLLSDHSIPIKMCSIPIFITYRISVIKNIYLLIIYCWLLLVVINAFRAYCSICLDVQLIIFQIELICRAHVHGHGECVSVLKSNDDGAFSMNFTVAMSKRNQRSWTISIHMKRTV